MFGNLVSGCPHGTCEEQRQVGSHSLLLSHQWMGHLVHCEQMSV